MAPLRFACIYVLDIGENEEIERVRPQSALIEMVRHSYLARFVRPTETAALHLTQCATLVSSVPVHYLRRAPSLLRLPEIARLVEEHAASQMAMGDQAPMVSG